MGAPTTTVTHTRTTVDMWSAAVDTGTSVVTMVTTTGVIMAGMEAMLTTRAIGTGDVN